MAIHCQLLFSTVLYILVLVSSIIVISTIAYVKSAASGNCYLFVKKDTTTASSLPCSFNLYTCGGTAIYAIIMAIYHGYGTIAASRESHIGRTMWVMPWLLLNSLVMVVMFICACVYSIGLHLTCSELGCSIEMPAYLSTVVAEVSLWLSVILWVCLIGIEGIRLMRNRRAISREVYVGPTTSDTINIGKVSTA